MDLELNFLKGQDSDLNVNIDRFGFQIRICGFEPPGFGFNNFQRGQIRILGFLNHWILI